MAVENVVGTAYVIVHALTDKISDDLKRGFKNSDRDLGRTGEGMAEAFSRGFSKVAKSSNVFTKFSSALRASVPQAEASRLQYAKFTRVSFAAGPAIAVLVGGVSSLIGGLGALVGSAGGAAASVVVLGNVFAALRIGMSAAKLALNGVSEALGRLNQSAGGGGAVDNTRQIEDAERRLALVIESNRERLADANNVVRRAQEALNEAFKAGREEIQQIGFQAENAALAEKRSGLELERAREQLAKAQDLPPNSRIRREAELALEEAELKFRQARDLSSDLNSEQDRLAREGVSGTNAVTSATEQLAQAEVQRARVLRDGARAQEEAERALKDAVDGNNQAVGGGGLNPFEGLNEYQIEFVKFLFGLKPLYEELKLVSSEAFLPPLQEAILMIVERAFPTILAGVSLVAGAMGQASISVARAVSDSENLRDTAMVFESSAAIIRSLGRTLGNVWDSALSALVGASQISIDFVNFLDSKSRQFSNFLNVKEATGELESFFDRAGQIAADWGTIFGNTAAGIGQIITANFGPGSGGDYLVQWLIGATEKFRNLEETAGGEDNLSRYFEGVAVNSQKIFSSVGALLTELIKLGDNPGIGETFDILAQGAPAVGQIAEKLIEAAPAMAEFVKNFAEFANAFTDSESATIFLETLGIALDAVNALLSNEVIAGIVIAISQVAALALAIGTVQKVSQFAFNAAAGSIGFFSGQIGKATQATQTLGTVIAGKGVAADKARAKFGGMIAGGGKAVGLLAVFAGVAGAVGAVGRQAQISAQAYDDFFESASGVKALNFNKIWEDQSITLKFFTGDTDSATTSLEEMTSASYKANEASAGFLGSVLGFIPEFKEVAESYAKAEDTLLSFGEALGDVASVNLGQAQSSFREFASQTDGSQEALLELFNFMPGLRDELKILAEENGLATDDVALLGLAMGDSEGSARILNRQFNDTSAAVLDTTGKIQGLADAIRDYTSAAVDSEREAIRYEEALDRVTESVEMNGDEFDISTEAGRNNREAMLNLVEATNASAVSNYEVNGSVDELTGQMAENRDELLELAGQFFDTEEEAAEYVDTLLMTPEEITAIVDAEGVPETKRDISGVQQQANTYATGSYTATVKGNKGSGWGWFDSFWTWATTDLFANGGIKQYANGGMSFLYRGSPGDIYQFAEPETRWEAFITGKQSDREKNIKVWQDAGRRLGIKMMPNIAGGLYSALSESMSISSSTASLQGARVVNKNTRSVNLTVNPARGMDETELARAISREIDFQLKRMEWEESYRQ